MTSLQLWGRHFSRSGSIFSSVQRFCQDMIVLVSGERLCGFLRRAETLSAQLRVGSEGTFCVLHKLLQNVGMQNWKTVPSLMRDVYFKDMFCVTVFVLLVEQMFLQGKNVNKILLKLFKMLFPS